MSWFLAMTMFVIFIILIFAAQIFFLSQQRKGKKN